MALLDEARRADLAAEPGAASLAVEDFLRRCLHWARVVELPRRRQAAQDSEDPEVAMKLHAWLSYIRFTEHALEELRDGRLDHWFRPGEETAGGAQPGDLGA